MWSFQDLGIELAVEWSLRDTENQLVWIDTFSAEARGPTGTAFTFKENITSLAREAVQNVMLASGIGILESPEIQQFVAKPN